MSSDSIDNSKASDAPIISPAQESTQQDGFFTTWSKKFQYLTNTGMSEEEREKFKQKLEADKNDRECKRCEEYKTWMLNYSMLKFDEIVYAKQKERC